MQLGKILFWLDQCQSNPAFGGVEILKMSQSFFFFCATYTKKAIMIMIMALEDQYIKHYRMQSLTNLC